MRCQIRIEHSGAICHLLAALCILLGTACSDDALSPPPTSTQSINDNENSALKELKAKVGIAFPTNAVLVNATDGGGREPSHQFYLWAVFSPTDITMPVMNQPGVKDYLNLPLESTVKFVQGAMGKRKIEQPQKAFTSMWQTNGFGFRGTIIRSAKGDYLIITQGRADPPQPLQHATNTVLTEASAIAVAEEEVKRVRDWKDVQSALLTFDGTQWTIMTFRLPSEYGGHVIVSVSTNGQIISIIGGK